MIRHAILGLLRERGDYGYSLKRRFEAFVGPEWRLNIGQVYQSLQVLERAGLVKEGASVRVAQRKRRMYELTPKGRLAVERWGSRQPARAETVRNELLIKLLVLGPERAEEALDQLRGEERRCRKRLDRLLAGPSRPPKDAAAAPDLSWECFVRRVGFEAAVQHTRAQLAWIESSRKDLEARWTSQSRPVREPSPTPRRAQGASAARGAPAAALASAAGERLGVS